MPVPQVSIYPSDAAKALKAQVERIKPLKVA
jgi:hypothetical protein